MRNIFLFLIISIGFAWCAIAIEWLNFEFNGDTLTAAINLVTAHEIGHAFGCSHCGNPNCIMYPYLRDYPFPDSFCVRCEDSIKWGKP